MHPILTSPNHKKSKLNPTYHADIYEEKKMLLHTKDLLLHLKKKTN